MEVPEEHPLARRAGFRPYSELSASERSGVADYLKAFEGKYGTIPGFEPRNYWWKLGEGEWVPFNTEPAIR